MIDSRDLKGVMARRWGLRLRNRDFRLLGTSRDEVDALDREMDTPEGRERLRRLLDAEGQRDRFD